MPNPSTTSNAPRRTSANDLVDLNSPTSPLDGPSFGSHSHIPLPPRMSLIPGLASSLKSRYVFYYGATMMDNKKHNFSSHPSPLIKFDQINVNGLCSSVRQQHLLNFFLHSSFGVLSLNDTCCLTSSSAKFTFKTEQSQYNFRSYWACSSSSHPHDSVNIPFTNTFRRSIHRTTIFLGNFNVNDIAYSSYPSRHFKLLRLLTSQYFTDYQAHSSSLTGPDNTYFYNNGSSRLDYIWSSPGFPAPGLFFQVVLCPDLMDRPFTDHCVLITIFDFNSCLAILAKSRLKQKKEERSFFAYTSTTVKQWDKFSSHVNAGFQLDATVSGPYVDYDFSQLSLDKLWHIFKQIVLGAAIEHLPQKHISNTYRHSYSPDFTKLIAINKFLDRFLFRLTTSRPSHPAQILQMTAALLIKLKELATLLPEYTIPTYTTSPSSSFKAFLRSQKSLVSAYLTVKFAQHTSDFIEYFTALRDEHFSSSLGTFIDSALSIERRSIMLDQVLVVLDSKPTFLTDPADIKQAAVAHFQSVVSQDLEEYIYNSDPDPKF
ncbi:hypothetical protein RhiirA4_473296 [Rhizophagus irregularis]|uniref:Endonuclease/exonuclease/phosphatase domain-containing protein n=1 Tax=Rhizophagus irregularis TaxID=588596 RepID=A0A2I1H6G3_9GLOM|nr:hypothetical protein RhiirA4_473296 [Rhizophagus irregularis]